MKIPGGQLLVHIGHAIAGVGKNLGAQAVWVIGNFDAVVGQLPVGRIEQHAPNACQDRFLRLNACTTNNRNLTFAHQLIHEAQIFGRQAIDVDTNGRISSFILLEGSKNFFQLGPCRPACPEYLLVSGAIGGSKVAISRGISI